MSPQNSHTEAFPSERCPPDPSSEAFPSVRTVAVSRVKAQVLVFHYSHLFFVRFKSLMCFFPDENIDGKDQGECEGAYGGCRETE